jgi:Cupredoxin-like domain
MRRKWVAVALLMLSGCGVAAVSETSVALNEFSVIPLASRLKAGTVDLSVSNSGEFSHTLVVSDSAGTVVAATALIRPGETSSLSIHLQPGAYMFTCRIVGESDTGEIIDHYQRGMAARVDVSA